MLNLHAIIQRTMARDHLSRYVLKILKGNHDSSDVVERPSECRLMQNSVDAVSTLLMNRSLVTTLILILIAIWVSGSLPDSIDNVLIAQLLKNSVACNDDEVVVVSDFEALDIRCRNNHLRVASVLRFFGFNVSNCP